MLPIAVFLLLPVQHAWAACETGPSSPRETGLILPDGSAVYSSTTDEGGRGFIGVDGSTAYVEMGGDMRDMSGHIEGRSIGHSFRVGGDVTSGPTMCVDDVVVP